MDLARVARIAHGMRTVIEKIPRGQLPTSMQHFPRGSCSDSALLLGAYLRDAGLSSWRHVSAGRASKDSNYWESHAWLNDSGVIVDITADQFLDAPAAVIVEEDSAWHRCWEVKSTAIGDFRHYNGPSVDYLRPVYALVEKMLETELLK